LELDDKKLRNGLFRIPGDSKILAKDLDGKLER